MTERQERDRVVACARSWVGTPYHHGASLKGVGADCARLIDGAFAEAGLIEPMEPGFYTHDWHLHRGEEVYLGVVEKYCRRIDVHDETSIRDGGTPHFVQDGDILLWRVGRTFSHGAIVTQWPRIVHASFPDHVVAEVSVLGTPMSTRPMRAYSFWGVR